MTTNETAAASAPASSSPMESRWYGGSADGATDSRQPDAPVYRPAEPQRPASSPETTEDYKLDIGKLPADVKLPDGMQLKIDDKDPRLPLARAFAREAGLDQNQFSRLLQLDALAKINAYHAETARLGEEMKKLGDKGQERLAAADRWLKTLGLSDKEYAEMSMTATTAAGVTAIEKLMAKAAGSVPANTGEQPPPKPTGRIEDRLYPNLARKAS